MIYKQTDLEVVGRNHCAARSRQPVNELTVLSRAHREEKRQAVLAAHFGKLCPDVSFRESLRVEWVTETRDDRTIEVRELQNLEVFDVGLVTLPAYESTTSGLRVKDLVEVRSEHDGWRAEIETVGRRRRSRYGRGVG